MHIELLLAHADDHQPVLERGLPLEFASTAPPPPATPLPEHLRYDSRDPNALPYQRWGVVAPEGSAGDRLLDVISPLRQAREQAQGAPAQIYRVPSSMSAMEAIRWKNRVYWDESVPEHELPRYLLLLGDLDEVSLPLQQVLASDLFVGRLAFRDEADYAAYAAKLLRWEQTPSPETQARALFFAVHDGTPATAIGYRAVMRPVLADCRARREKGIFPVREIHEIEPSSAAADAFLSMVARPEPTVLFTLSHGLGAPRGGWTSAQEQRVLQGAMNLEKARLTAMDIAGKRFLPGGIWFFLACFSGATPAESAYAHWLYRLGEAQGMTWRIDSVLDSLPKAGSRPFVAALPQAALANPEGPLAVMGHADLAWTYSFQELGPNTRGRPSRFQGVFQSLADGCRAGVAYHELLRFFGETNTHLSTLADEDAQAEVRGQLRLDPPTDGHTRSGEAPAAMSASQIAEKTARRVERANLWMLRNDLLGYILLGDPAVRLPLSVQTKAEPVPTPAGDLQTRAAGVLGFTPA